jgi:hypothetical protein
MASRMWYLLAAAILAAGAAGAALFLPPRLEALQERLVHVVVPGEAIVSLDQAGDYTIFHEARSVVDGTLYHAEDISGLAVALHSAADGEGVALRHPGATTSYTIAGRSGTSIFSFAIARPGDYRLTAEYADGRREPRTVLAVGQGVVGGLFAAILGTLAIALGGLAAGGAIAVVTFRKRRGAARAAVAATRTGMTS